MQSALSYKYCKILDKIAIDVASAIRFALDFGIFIILSDTLSKPSNLRKIRKFYEAILPKISKSLAMSALSSKKLSFTRAICRYRADLDGTDGVFRLLSKFYEHGR